MTDYDGILTISGGRTKRANAGDSVNIRATLRFEGSTENDHETDLAFTDPTADRTITFPDATGNVLLDSQDIDLADDVKLLLGDGDDLQIYHDGSNSIIKDNANSGGASIKYLAGTQTFQNSGASKTMAVFNANGSADLHHNGTKKFETTASGIKTSGTVRINDVYEFPTSDGSADQVLKTNGSGVLSFIDNTQVILAELSIPGIDLQTDTNAFRFNCPYALTVKKLDIFLDSHGTSGNVTVTVTNTTDSNAMISLTASGTNTSASTTTVSNSSCDSGDIITFAITATPANAQGLRANLTFVRS